MKTSSRLYYIVQYSIFMLFGIYLFFNLLGMDFVISGSSSINLFGLTISILLNISVVLLMLYVIPLFCIVKFSVKVQLPYINEESKQVPYKRELVYLYQFNLYKIYQVIRC